MKLKEIMFNQNIKQNKLASDLDISTTSLNNYCNNKTEPDIKTLIKLANYLNVSLDYLCGRQWNNNIGHIDEKRKDTLKTINELSDENFACVQAYLTGILINEEQKQNALQKFRKYKGIN